MKITKSTIKLTADTKAVIAQFHKVQDRTQIERIVERINGLNEEEVNNTLKKVFNDFSGRHRNIEEAFTDHCKQLEYNIGSSHSNFSNNKKLLLGMFFTQEYSFQAAALFNPSVVPHPDQTGLISAEQRFIMSLRATGEGHISSIAFQTGIIDASGNITLDAASGYFTPLKKNTEAILTKEFIIKRASLSESFDKSVINALPETFTTDEALHILNSAEYANNDSARFLKEVLNKNYELKLSVHLPINEKVIFPSAADERMGMEDVRFVKFTDNEQIIYYGTYTAYDGKIITSRLIETTDFEVFKIRALYGKAVNDKGMALFPEKINGKYVMVSRQGGHDMNIMFSDDLYIWQDFELLSEPQYTWDLMKTGNCGSPIKTDKGWLLLTHGVGTMRTYVISAILLDLNDPKKIIGRLDKALLQAEGDEREGYVPNVVYTCGMLRHENLLFIPYGLSDAAIGFATVDLNELLDEILFH
ncbi:MAG: glycoside hydrolase family 130 protein [Chitinophagaceae bacterium]